MNSFWIILCVFVRNVMLKPNSLLPYRSISKKNNPFQTLIHFNVASVCCFTIWTVNMMLWKLDVFTSVSKYLGFCYLISVPWNQQKMLQFKAIFCRFCRHLFLYYFCFQEICIHETTWCFCINLSLSEMNKYVTLTYPVLCVHSCLDWSVKSI